MQNNETEKVVAIGIGGAIHVARRRIARRRAWMAQIRIGLRLAVTGRTETSALRPLATNRP